MLVVHYPPFPINVAYCDEAGESLFVEFLSGESLSLHQKPELLNVASRVAFGDGIDLDGGVSDGVSDKVSLVSCENDHSYD